jgi:ABC-2 type transport system ATP-binding protein
VTHAGEGLEVAGLSFRYGRKEALAGVSLSVGAGRFCALLGPNGAGKSTLFALLTGLFVAPSGRIAIAGHDLARAPRAALARLGVVFQQPTADPDLTVRQNLAYFAGLQGMDRRTGAARAAEALERLGMAERAGERVRDLNGGHRRRMEIARALMHGPRVLLLDEPTVGLDAASRAGLVAHVHALAGQGLSILWATHLTDEVGPGDDLVILHRGRVVAAGLAGEVAGDAGLRERFLGLTGGAAAAGGAPA